MAIGAAVAMVVAAGAKYSQGQSNAKSIQNQNEISKVQSEFQEEMLEEKRKDILAQGDEQAAIRQQELRAMLGAQKVSFAAQGIEVEGELGEGLARDAKDVAEKDVKAIKNNAWKQAMGVEMDQADIKLQRNFDQVSSDARAQDAYASGVSGAVSSLGSAASTGMSSGMFGPNSMGGSTGKRIPVKNKRSNYN